MCFGGVRVVVAFLRRFLAFRFTVISLATLLEICSSESRQDCSSRERRISQSMHSIL